MKKMLFFPVVILTSLFVTNSAFASIDQNLKYGQKNTEVSELQEFLSAQGFLSSSPTGFFGLMTLKAVKAYQISQKLPSTGFVGPMTREKVNADIAVEVESSNEAEIAETGTTTPIVNTPVYVAPMPTPTPTPTSPSVNTGNVNQQSQVVKNDSSTVAVPDVDKTSIEVHPYDQLPLYPTNKVMRFNVYVITRSGNKISQNPISVTDQDGKNFTVNGGYDLYNMLYTPTHEGLNTLSLYSPDINAKKDFSFMVGTSTQQ